MNTGQRRPKSLELTYRGGFAIQAVGAGVFTVLYVIGHRYMPWALALAESGIVISILASDARMTGIKKALIVVFGIGALLQILTLSGISFNGYILFSGLMLTLSSSAVLCARDALATRTFEGWLLVMGYPVAVLPNFSDGWADKFNILSSTLLTMLLIIYVKKIMTAPLPDASAVSAPFRTVTTADDHSEKTESEENQEKDV